jgi:uncharacterized protein (DUF302 family)
MTMAHEMAERGDDGTTDRLVVARSPHDVASTVERVVDALNQRDIAIFARIDHAGGARAAGLELADEVLLVFGSPAVGTALMQADPRAGIDLPLRMLVWSDGGTTAIAFRDPHELAADHALAGAGTVLDRLRGLLDQLVLEVTST